MGLLDTLKRPFDNYQRRQQEIDELKGMFKSFLSDGIISPSERAELEAFYRRTALGPDKIEAVKREAFQIMVNIAIADRRVTDQELQALRNVAVQLSIPFDDVAQMEQQTSFYAALQFYESNPVDRFPTISPSYAILQRGEVAYLETPANLLEERVVSRQYSGASSGVSFRIMRGVTYRVGQTRGQLQAQTGIIPVSSGSFLITNQRLVFSGTTKSVAVAYNKLIDLQLFSDALKFAISNRQKPVIIGGFHHYQSIELSAIIISKILNYVS